MPLRNVSESDLEGLCSCGRDIMQVLLGAPARYASVLLPRRLAPMSLPPLEATALDRLLDAFESDILPLTETGAALGNKVFAEPLFLSTHEPCSRCLSAIIWSGFDNVVCLFSHQHSRDAFAIPLP